MFSCTLGAGKLVFPTQCWVRIMIGMLEISSIIEEVERSTKCHCVPKCEAVPQKTVLKKENYWLCHCFVQFLYFCSFAEKATSALQEKKRVAYCCLRSTVKRLSHKQREKKITVAIETKHLHGFGILFSRTLCFKGSTVKRGQDVRVPHNSTLKSALNSPPLPELLKLEEPPVCMWTNDCGEINELSVMAVAGSYHPLSVILEGWK